MMKWRMSDPKFVRQIIANRDLVAAGKKTSATIMANLEERKRRADRARSKAGPVASELIKRSWEKRRELGQMAFGNYGGNGRPPTQSESVLLALFPEATHNPIVLTGAGAKSFKNKTGKQHYAKPDLGWLDIKLAVEVDGTSHLKPAQIARDSRKEEILRGLGWTLLRFSVSQVMSDTTTVQEAISSTILRLRAIQATPSVVW